MRLDDQILAPAARPSGAAGQSSAEIRARDRRHVWHTWSPLAADRSELTLSHGVGHRVWDIDGVEYIDAASLHATTGFGDPDVQRAIVQQMERLHHFDLSIASHEPAGLLAERIASYLPDGLTKTLFVNSGSEGCEAAVMIAASYWSHLGQNRRRVVSFARGYHGSTLVSRSLSRLPRIGPAMSEPLAVTYVDLPGSAREVREPAALPLLLAAFEEAVGNDPDDMPMAVLVEPFLNVGGAVVLPDGFLAGLRDLCDRSGALLVLDEVFTGYGRTGRMFACDREDVAPDIIVSSKGLSSGYVPIAAVTVQQHVHDSFEHDPVMGGLRYGHTTSGHPVACAAALATLDIVEKHGLVAAADIGGARLLSRLSGLLGSSGVIDVRGVGLIAAIEFAEPETAGTVKVRAQQLGLLLRQQGAVLMAVPPLNIGDTGIDDIAAVLEDAVSDQPG